jgi:hypothetical protein
MRSVDPRDTVSWLRRSARRGRPPAARGACVYCGERAVTWDHVVPLAEGGSSRPDNLVPACRRCNGLKGKQSLVNFLLQIRHHRVSLPMSAYPATGERFPCPGCKATVYLPKPYAPLHNPRVSGEKRTVHSCAAFPNGLPDGSPPRTTE